ncbi:MAG: hypothetical protein WC455_18870 [Dehalococcoidia bacterium]|jgi:hypothetical protein
MKIRIDANGYLQIERPRGWKSMECAQRAGEWCSDSCPLFGEPEDDKVCEKPVGEACPSRSCKYCGHYMPADQGITICNERLLMGTIEDMRRSA